MAKKVAAAGPVEVPWALPDGWRWERMDTVAPVNPRRGPDNLTDGTEVTFVPMAAVKAETGRIDVSARKPIGSARKGFTRFGSNDVIFAKITPCMENGKIAVIPDLPHGIGFGSTEFHVLAPREVSARYLYYWVSQRGFRETAEFNMTGTAGQKRVPTDFMRDALMPVPPRPMQDAIVARIDELLAEIDDGEAALARARHNLATSRKALLKAAVTGELTADWRAANPTNETGTDLLARILAERRDRWEAEPRNKRKAFIEPIGPEAVDLPPLPGSWTWLSIQQLATVVRGASPRPAGDPRYFGGDIPWITVGSLTRGNAKTLTSVDLFVTPLGRQHSRFVEAGTLLFTNSGATLGVPKITSIGGCINDGSVALLGLDEPVKSYVYHFLRTQTERLRALNQGAAQPNLNTTIVKEIAVPVPPLNEMVQLIATLERLLVEVEAGEDDLQHLRTAPATLRQSILAAAFRGELV